MKIIVKKEYDGKNYVGSCENLANCYAQTTNPDDLIANLRKAIELYRKSYENKNQTIPDRYDLPVFDNKIRFNTISTSQLTQLLIKNNYRIEIEDDNSILFANSRFPFNRINLPISKDLSPIIISKLFGKENVIYVNKRDLSIHSSA